MSKRLEQNTLEVFLAKKKKEIDKDENATKEAISLNLGLDLSSVLLVCCC